ncbi:MAG: hypothetical protein JRD68_00080 [Deltaproteobacteria bacterium]|nr:hypothetical protein [Deltaproteobacteria bacterium]
MSGILKRTVLLVLDNRKGFPQLMRPTGFNKVITSIGECVEIGNFPFNPYQVGSDGNYNRRVWDDDISRVDEIRFIDPNQLQFELADNRVHNANLDTHAGY